MWFEKSPSGALEGTLALSRASLCLPVLPLRPLGRASARRGLIGCVYKLFEIDRWRDILELLGGDGARAFAWSFFGRVIRVFMWFEKSPSSALAWTLALSRASLCLPVLPLRPLRGAPRLGVDR
ncbi:hypothetical protein I858_011030 [Planococcus versutus]|uniref:Uncharacterized protein n=1 Tax=Planococcus versutus TaxID=1302659 RepID=A0A1B1S2W2_9BACL|nr:hypothetical protein I858_011030 [Planococcus versutus]